jgi:hypothetical protein
MLRNELYCPWFEGNTNWGVEITSGDFKDVVIQIEKMEFSDEPNNVELVYHVISKPDILEEELSKNPVFESTIELIVNDILKEAIEIHEQNRNSNS